MLPVEDPEDPRIMTGEAVALQVRPTGFLLSAAGAAIDWCVSVAVLIGLLIALGALGGPLGPELTRALLTVSIAIAVLVVPMAQELVSHGRSLGRWAVGARVVRDDGGAAGFRQAFVRALTGVAEIYLTFGGAAALAGLIDPRARRLGDLLAGTVSQYQRVPRAPLPAPPLPAELAAWAQLADVARLPDRLERRVAAFVREAPGYTAQARFGLAAELAAECRPFVYPVPPVPAEVLLIGIAAVRRARDAAALAGADQRLARLAPVLSALPHGFPDRGTAAETKAQ